MARVSASAPDPDRRIREVIYEAAASELGVDVSELCADQAVEDLEFWMALEWVFDVELTDAAMERVRTLDDLVRAVETAPKRRPPDATINRWISN